MNDEIRGTITGALLDEPDNLDSFKNYIASVPLDEGSISISLINRSPEDLETVIDDPDIESFFERIKDYVLSFFDNDNGIGGLFTDKRISFEMGAIRIIYGRESRSDCLLYFTDIVDDPILIDLPDGRIVKQIASYEIDQRYSSEILQGAGKIGQSKRICIDVEDGSLLKLNDNAYVDIEEEFKTWEIMLLMQMCKAARADRFEAFDTINDTNFRPIYSSPKKYNVPAIDMLAVIKKTAEEENSSSLSAISKLMERQDFIDTEELLDLLREKAESIVIDPTNFPINIISALSGTSTKNLTLLDIINFLENQQEIFAVNFSFKPHSSGKIPAINGTIPIRIPLDSVPNILPNFRNPPEA